MLSSHWWRFCFCAMTCKEIWTKKNTAEKWSEKIQSSLRECEKFITHGQLVSQWQNSLHLVIQIFRLTSHNWKMEEHGLMLQLKSSLLIALASARCQPWDRTTDLITIVSGQLWNEIEVTHPSHNEVTQPLLFATSHMCIRAGSTKPLRPLSENQLVDPTLRPLLLQYYSTAFNQKNM